MKKISFISLAITHLLFISCNKSEEIETSEPGFLIFGHFYGECWGETCIETYKLDASSLSEADDDIYAGGNTFYESTFTLLSDDLFVEVQDLIDIFPSDFFEETETTFGCPDCADGGGLFIERKINENHDFWILDQSKEDVPTYMHPFMDAINTKIELINN